MKQKENLAVAQLCAEGRFVALIYRKCVTNEYCVNVNAEVKGIPAFFFFFFFLLFFFFFFFFCRIKSTTPKLLVISVKHYTIANADTKNDSRAVVSELKLRALYTLS
jgi:hypothetical protein